jgi:hypothetical protein
MIALGVGLLSKAVAAGFGVGVATAIAVAVGVPAVRSRLLAPSPAPVEISVATTAPALRVPAVAALPPPAVSEPVSDPPLPAIEPQASPAAPALRAAPRSEPPMRPVIDSPVGVSQPTSAAPAEPPIEQGISAEVGILLDARRMLANDPSRAIVLLARHAAEFPAGELTMEREVLMIEALDRAGQRTEALRRSHELLARSPNAFYAARLRQLILDEPGHASPPPN